MQQYSWPSIDSKNHVCLACSTWLVSYNVTSGNLTPPHQIPSVVRVVVVSVKEHFPKKKKVDPFKTSGKKRTRQPLSEKEMTWINPKNIKRIKSTINRALPETRGDHMERQP